MIAKPSYIANLEMAMNFANTSGAIVECGTWKGGMIAGMAELLGESRAYYLFDSFEGLPPAKEIDGVDALKYQEDKNSQHYHNNCTASEYEARAAMDMADIQNPTIVKGWFQDTLPGFQFDQGIAILILDADWYDSTFEILNNFFNQVNKGGLILIDDYYTWAGCSKAVHDYLSRNQLAERIRTYEGICFIVKE